MIEADESTIVLSHHYDRLGVHYKPGDTVTLPTSDARSLVAAGYAQALATPMVDTDPDGTTTVRSTAPTRLTTASGTTYSWPHEGEAVPVRNTDLEAVLALPGFDRADPVEDEQHVGGEPAPDEMRSDASLSETDAPVRTEPYTG